MYTAKYRCKNCNETFTDYIEFSEADASREINLISGKSNKDLPRTSTLSVHHCSNNDMGLAEFIGFSLVDGTNSLDDLTQL